MPPSGGTGPEQFPREETDKLLAEAGWMVQGREEINLSAARGITSREFKLADGFGFADYLLFVEEHAVGALKARPLGQSLGGIEPQVQKHLLDYVPGAAPFQRTQPASGPPGT